MTKAIQKFAYRVAGIPVVVRKAFAPPASDALGAIRDIYARQYFITHGRKDRSRIIRAWLTWPIVLIEEMARFTWRNGRIIQQRYDRSVVMQLADQIRLYFRFGILPRWYYIFSLYEQDVRRQARSFLNRFETKLALFRLLNWPGKSPLNDKDAFASHCRAHGIDAVDVLVIARDGDLHWTGEPILPARDLFIKPTNARGGKGAERWDIQADGRYRDPDGVNLTADDLLARLARESRDVPRLIQLRRINHPAIADLSNGALCTARIMTCLDEKGQGEVVAAVFRMAIGRNVVVDNIHAGGIAAEVDVASGRLGQASDLGDDVRLGWLDRHPDTDAAIKGRMLPLWSEAKELAVRAHAAFADRTVIGWDIALTPDGPCLVEGNSGPDVDLLQRPMRRGLGGGRLAELMAFHLAKRGWAAERQ